MRFKAARREIRIWPSLIAGLLVIPLLAAVVWVTMYAILSPSLPAGQAFGREVIGEWMSENRTTLHGFLTLMLPIHGSLLVLTIAAAAGSGEPFRERLGLVRSSIPLWQYFVFILGGLGADPIPEN